MQKIVNFFLKDYYQYRTKKVNSFKKLTMIFGIFSCTLGLGLLFVSLPIAILVGLSSIFAWNRFFFFTDVYKKFEYCNNYFNKVVNFLSSKKSSYKIHYEEILNEIIKLEQLDPNKLVEEIPSTHKISETQCINETNNFTL